MFGERREEAGCLRHTVLGGGCTIALSHTCNEDIDVQGIT